MLTKPEAYREIAKAYYTPPSRRTERQKRKTRRGVCLAIFELWQQTLCSHRTRLLMNNDISRSMVPYHWWLYTFFCPLNREGDILRADWCTLMALISEEE